MIRQPDHRLVMRVLRLALDSVIKMDPTLVPNSRDLKVVDMPAILSDQTLQVTSIIQDRGHY